MPKPKAYVYAVKNGHNPGLYYTWDECEKQVIGYHMPIYNTNSKIIYNLIF